MLMTVVTKNYADVPGFYGIFGRIEDETEEVTKAACAALAITRKYYLQRNHLERALGLFEEVAECCDHRTQFLRFVVETLVQFELPKEAEEFLARFPSQTR